MMKAKQPELKPGKGVLVCKVTATSSMWIARCDGETASSTGIDGGALRRVGRKVFGHDETQAFEVGTKGNVTTWLLREKPDQKSKIRNQRSA